MHHWKISRQTAAAMRRFHALGASVRETAEQFRVANATARKVVHRRPPYDKELPDFPATAAAPSPNHRWCRECNRWRAEHWFAITAAGFVRRMCRFCENAKDARRKRKREKFWQAVHGPGWSRNTHDIGGNRLVRRPRSKK